MKFFNLEMKDNDHMDLASKIKSIMHDDSATSVKMVISITTFIKAFYPTYSHYLKSLQASDELKSLDFDSLVDKIAKCEKDFKKNIAQTTRETIVLPQKDKNQSHDSSRGQCSNRGRVKNNFRGRG